MTYEKGLFAQADPGIVSGSTIERNKMSTKTIYKRIALVAVAALGMGVLTSVSPANAALTIRANQGITGTASDGLVVLANSASTLINTEANTTAALSGAFKITKPDGTVHYVGLNYANAAVGVVTLAGAAPAATLTMATTFLDQTGLYRANSALATATGDLDGLSELQTATLAATATSAVATDISFFVTKATPSFSGGTGRTVTTATAISQDVNGVATVNIVSDNASASYSVSSSGVGAITSAFASNAGFSGQTLTASATDTVANNNGVSVAGGVTWTPAATNGKSFIQVKVSSAVAGSQVVSVTPLNASGTPGTAVKATITWGATPTVSAGTTISRLNAGTGVTAAAGADATVVVAKTAATKAGNIVITLNDQDGNGLNGLTVSATIAGPGLILLDCDTTAGDETGTARTSSATCGATENIVTIGINADGTSGAGVVTVSVGTTTITTKTVYFYDSPATVVAKQNHKVLSTAGGVAGITPAANAGTGADIANTPAVILTVKDKNGILIPGLTAASTSVTAVSSDTTVMSQSISLSANDGSGAANTAAGTYNVQVASAAKASGSTATLKFRVVVSAALGTFVESAPLTYTLGGTAASVALSLNKASYSVGEAAVATLTVKDASGNAAADSDYANILTAALTSSLGVNKTLFGTTVSTLGGVSTVSFNAPATSGATWTISGTTGTGPSVDKAKALTATAAVTSGADMQALTTLINSLIAKINALSKLVTKINKKVRA